MLFRALACVALVTVISACGTSGRELRDPAPGATAPPRRTSSTVSANNQIGTDDSSVVLRPTGFTLAAPGWAADGVIPVGYGCGGADLAPSLTISGVPDGTAELLLIASDTSAPGSTRWVVAHLPPTITAIDPGALPAGSFAVTNSTGTPAWAGPCPQPGASTSFQLRLYALRTPSAISDASAASAVTTALTTASSAAVLRGTYTRPL